MRATTITQPAEATAAALEMSLAAPPVKRDGPIAAVMLATGLASVVLGFLTVLAEANAGAKDWLQFNDRVGPLSGKTLLTVAVFVLTWCGLSVVLRKRELPWRPLVVATVVLVALGVLGTFPTFFQAFASE